MLFLADVMLFFAILIYWLGASYLLFNVLYLFISAAAGRLGKADDTPISDTGGQLRRIAVLIPAYREDAVILGSVIANLQQDYPSSQYDLIVIADSFLPETIEKLSQYPIKIIPVQFEQSTVQKSISYALNTLPENTYDIVLISDADNHMAPDFLKQINQAFSQGWRAIQGHRTAKNTNTSVAVFDAMNEEINNNLFRAGQRALGLSATLIGSGMAFESDLMKRALNQIQTVGGYDKELEMLLAIAGIRIGYLQNALIYDEKVQNIAVFQRQRTRWIAAQLYFVKAYFKTGIQQLMNGNGQAFNTFIKSLLLPRMILLAVLGLLALVSLFIGGSVLLLAWILLILLIASLIISIPNNLFQKITARDFITLPILIFSMFRSLINYKQASKKFLHTPHVESSEPG